MATNPLMTFVQGYQTGSDLRQQDQMYDLRAKQAQRQDEAAAQEAQWAKYEQFGKQARMVDRALKSGNVQLANSLYQRALPLAQEVAPGEYPAALTENDAQMVASIADAFDPQPAAQEQFTLAPGSARYDASGKVIAAQPFGPANMQFVGVPTGDGGEQKMLFDPRAGTFSAPNYGVQAGPGLDPTQDFPRLASNGAQATSLYRDPERNAKVGGVANSQHMAGTAGDFVVPPEQRASFIAQARQMGYDAIDEGDHVHVELPKGAQAAGRFGPGQQLGRTPPKSRSFSQLTPQEAAAAGLPPGTVAQINDETGQISVISKPDARAGTGVTPLSAGEAAKVRRDFKETKDALNTFKAFDQALKDIPSGVDLLLDGKAQGRLGTSYNNARAALRILYNTGVLQPGELPMLESALRDPTSVRAVLDPRTRPQIDAQLDELYRTITRGIENQVASYPQIFNQGRFDSFRNERAAPQGGPKPGDVVDGYRFKGGRPGDQSSWEKL